MLKGEAVRVQWYYGTTIWCNCDVITPSHLYWSVPVYTQLLHLIHILLLLVNNVVGVHVVRMVVSLYCQCSAYDLVLILDDNKVFVFVFVCPIVTRLGPVPYFPDMSRWTSGPIFSGEVRFFPDIDRGTSGGDFENYAEPTTHVFRCF